MTVGPDKKGSCKSVQRLALLQMSASCGSNPQACGSTSCRTSCSEADPYRVPYGAHLASKSLAARKGINLLGRLHEIDDILL